MSTSLTSQHPVSWLILRPATWRQIGADLTYLLPGFFISLASFVLLITLGSLGVSTLVIWIGLPLLVLTLACSRWFAHLNRLLLAHWAGSIPPVHYQPAQRATLTGMAKSLTDAQLWRDFAHGAGIAFAYRTGSFVATVTWLALIVGGLSNWYWQQFLPCSGDCTLAQLVGLDTWLGLSPATVEALLGVAYGLLALLTLPLVLRLLAVVDVAFTRALLTNEYAALRARGEELATSRAQVVAEEAHTLRKIERDLHDGPQQRLIRLQMDVAAAQRRLLDDPEGARGLLDGALEQSREALAELRGLSRGIAPPLLSDRGLLAAVESLAARSPVPVHVESSVHAGQRLPAGVENAAYFVVSEALANVAKHAGAGSVRLSLALAPAFLAVSVTDDGQGGAHPAKGHGLSGLADRLSGVDGTLEITSPEGGPTRLLATIPLPA